MRTLILCVGVIGLAAIVSGQSQLPPKVTHIVYAPSTPITVNDLQHDTTTNTVYARGQVRIEAAPSTFTADEADIHILKASRAANDLVIELRGNVHVVIAPSIAR